MILTGIADEAGRDIETQIQAHRELGWDAIELRLVNHGMNVAGELPDDDFDRVYGALQEAEMKVTCFASRIANWSRHIRDDFAMDREDLIRTIPRMKRLGVGVTRVMSWKGEGVPEPEWRDEAVRRMKELSRIASGEGITLAHENCDGWGGLSASHMLELKQAVDSPNFVLLYDMGNTISHGLDPDDFFRTIRGRFDYLHVKDARVNPEGGRSADYTYCGEGDARLAEYLKKILLEDGYDGVISIEPHVAAVVHLTGENASPEAMYGSYIRYGRMFMELVAGATARD